MKIYISFQFPVAFKGEKEFDPTKYPKIEEVYEMLDKYLEGQDYVAGKNLTIADLSITATVTTSEVYYPSENYIQFLFFIIDRIKIKQ